MSAFNVKYKGMVLSIPNNFSTPLKDITILNEMLYNYFKKMHETTEPRIVIIETWFLLEYYVRSILSSALGLYKFDTKDYDTKYELLPNSFSACFWALENLLKEQRKLPIEPKKREYFIKSGKFSVYLMENHRDVFDKLVEIEDEYDKINRPECYQTGTFIPMDFIKEEQYQNNHLIDMCRNIDNNWFKNVDAFNKIRNQAVHSYDIDKTFKLLKKKKVENVNKVEDIKGFCLDLISKLCSFEECSPNVKIDIDMDE